MNTIILKDEFMKSQNYIKLYDILIKKKSPLISLFTFFIISSSSIQLYIDI